MIQVYSVDGKLLMSVSPSKAKTWLRQGLAKLVENKSQLSIQLTGHTRKPPVRKVISLIGTKSFTAIITPHYASLTLYEVKDSYGNIKYFETYRSAREYYQKLN